MEKICGIISSMLADKERGRKYKDNFVNPTVSYPKEIDYYGIPHISEVKRFEKKYGLNFISDSSTIFTDK